MCTPESYFSRIPLCGPVTASLLPRLVQLRPHPLEATRRVLVAEGGDEAEEKMRASAARMPEEPRST